MTWVYRSPAWRARSGLLLLMAASLSLSCAKEEAPPPPPPEVVVAPVLQRDVPLYLEAIGETRGSTEIEVRARVEGFLQTINYQEGNLVKKGQLLYTIDARPFEAALARARGVLAEAEAQLARTKQDVARYEPLVQKNAIPRQTYETSLSLRGAAEAAREAAQAQVQSAEIDLSHTRVEAPADGLAGRTEVYPGTLVGRGESTLLTRISQLESIHVRFTLPERDYLKYAKAKGSRPAPSAEELERPIHLILADQSEHTHTGKLVFVDRSVDPRTGTILLEAAFPNPEGVVRPGQYARVRAAVETRKGAILIPQRAITELQGVYSVAVVGADDTVNVRPVEPGDRIGSLRVIDSGLSAGDRVVVEGMQKVRPGVKVSARTTSIEDPALDAATAVASDGA